MSKAPTRPKLERQHGIYLRVGEIASLLRIDVKTARKWIDTGRLQGHRVPGNVNTQRERRVQYEVLRKFLLHMGYKQTVRDLETHAKAIEQTAELKPAPSAKPGTGERIPDEPGP